METALLIVVVVLGAIVALTLAFSAKTIVELKGSVKKLEGKLDRLQGDISRCEKGLDAVKTTLANRAEEPIVGVWNAFQRHRHKGWFPALLAVGTRLVGAYLQSRKRPAALEAPSPLKVRER